MDFLVRFTQLHETFRVPELQALATLESIPLTILSYDPTTPFCLVRLPSRDAAVRLVRRSVLAQSIHEHWATASTLDQLHEAIQTRLPGLLERNEADSTSPSYATASWKFNIDSFRGTHPPANRSLLINTFRYLPLKGPIQMKTPDLEFTIFETYPPVGHQASAGDRKPELYHFGRHLARTSRDLVTRYDLKNRPYISTTSMDAELALLTANLALARPGTLFYDPFVGTAGFPLACAAFGAMAWGSDIDGRAVRGTGGDARVAAQRARFAKERTIRANFVHYGLVSQLGDVFTSDLTHTPLRRVGFAGKTKRLFDGIVCDPPYGVREGLRVLGCRDPAGMPWLMEGGQERCKDPNYVPPKKPYSFIAMLNDILHFASETLVDNGRLAFWMPTANDETQEIPVPSHPCLEEVAICTQPFNKWSRRLITYRKRPDAEVDPAAVEAWQAGLLGRDYDGVTADELNPFRKGYFTKFRNESPPS